MISWIKTKLKSLYHRRFGEDRKYPRVPISVKVVNVTSGNFSYYHATNLSMGGMFLKSEEPLPIGSNLMLQFSMPDQKENLEVRAEVVRIPKAGPDDPFPSGMGVKFKDLSEPAREAITSFINTRT